MADIEAENFSLTGEYDYIVASEVLEHMRNPEVLMDKLKGHSKYLMISVPNSAFYRYCLELLFKSRFLPSGSAIRQSTCIIGAIKIF